MLDLVVFDMVKNINIIVMSNFIEDYLRDPSQAVRILAQRASAQDVMQETSDEQIYGQLSSGEFKLYETITLVS